MDPLIRNRHHAVEAVEAYSPAEQQSSRRRKTVGMVLGPAVFVVLLSLPIDTLTPAAHRLPVVVAVVSVRVPLLF